MSPRRVIKKRVIKTRFVTIAGTRIKTTVRPNDIAGIKKASANIGKEYNRAAQADIATRAVFLLETGIAEDSLKAVIKAKRQFDMRH